MLEPWNDLSIQAPPVNMFLCVNKVDVPALKHVCNNIIKVLSKQSPLHKESALCSRFLYKYDQKFRNDIGYRSFRKVHTALKKYLALNLLKDIENFLLALPSECDDEQYLPTRQMLEYVMLRIIAFSKIMLRICICSKQAAIFFLNRIKRSESHWMSLLPYALLSRLWSMTMVLTQHSSAWYSNLYPYLNKLDIKGLRFLPDNYELPEDLEQWLDLKNIDNFGKFDWGQKKLAIEDNILLEADDENNLFDNIVNFINQSNTNDTENQLSELLTEDKSVQDPIDNLSTEVTMDEGQVLSRDSSLYSQTIDQGAVVSRECFKLDQGEALSRESFKVLLGNQTKPDNKSPQNETISENKEQTAYKNVKQIKKETEHTHKKVFNITELKKFLDREQQFRDFSDDRCLTNHLSFMQWHALKNVLLKLCTQAKNRKIERKFKKIWKEKCLVYK